MYRPQPQSWVKVPVSQTAVSGFLRLWLGPTLAVVGAWGEDSGAGGIAMTDDFFWTWTSRRTNQRWRLEVRATPPRDSSISCNKTCFALANFAHHKVGFRARLGQVQAGVCGRAGDMQVGESLATVLCTETEACIIPFFVGDTYARGLHIIRKL